MLLWIKSTSSRNRQLTLEESFSELYVMKNRVRSIVEELQSLTDSANLSQDAFTEVHRSLDEIISLETQFKSIVEQKRRKLDILEKTCNEVNFEFQRQM